ncbi:MAG: metallophosphoesterase [Trueperaceae bacterium]
MRLAVLSDLHLGPDRGGKRGSHGAALLDAFLAHAARDGADLLLDLGDRVNEVDAAQDDAHLRHVADAFTGATTPRVHLLGNHDLHHLTRADNARILNAPMESEAIDLGRIGGVRWRLLAFRPDASYEPGHGCMRMTDGDLTWLDDALAQEPDAATVVASHVPLMRVPLEGNPYFAERPHSRAWHANVDDATAVLLRHPQVVACLHGHTHQPDVTVLDGLPFVTVPSATEAFPTDPEPSGGWATVRLGDRLDVQVHGEAAWRWSAALQLPRRRWSAQARASRSPR